MGQLVQTVHGHLSMGWSLLQNSTLTIEEFHSKLQEATNFPLRPFVIPFLKVTKSFLAGASLRVLSSPPSQVSFSAAQGNGADHQIGLVRAVN